MTSPAERFARATAAQRHPETRAFAETQRFDLDPFQIAGCESLEDGRSVLVAAPTGAGKTIVGEFAIHLSMLASNDKAFYTTPMKALSNQKFRELGEVYGADAVGLLTGDTNINSGARIVVMTTEVLRNMLYADSAVLQDLRFVIMDEVHYLADRFRGPVWEEVILHLPRSVRLVALSATVSNAEEFGEWIEAVRGDTDVIVSETRPVPLEQHALVRGELLPLFDDQGGGTRVNRELARLGSGGASAPAGRGRGRGRGAPPRPRGGGGFRVDRGDVVRLLARATLLPAIFFIFSRAGCDAAVGQLRRSDVRLTTSEERAEIREVVEEATRHLLEEDLAVLGFWEWRADLARGIAAHHAGMLPVFKEVVEELFRRKLVKVVFATETLALGINMPARTVVLERLEKFNGESVAQITAGEYTQLTGRAGRRGIDVEGHAVIQWADALDPQAVAALASRRTYPLISSFRPTYNMAVNLIERFGRRAARDVLESSFAQFQADRAVVDLARQVRDEEASLAGYREAMTCDRGDFTEYSAIRRQLSELEKRHRTDATASRATRDARQRELSDLRTRMQRHPCHRCPEREDHARWAERSWRLERKTASARRQIDARTGAIARVFDRVVDVLGELEYVTGSGAETVLTESGRRMARIYGERDLLVAESLRRGVWRGLDASSLAALASTIVYEPRRESDELDPRSLPRGAFRKAFDALHTLWAELDDLERAHRLPGSEPPAAGLASAVYGWARGLPLDRALQDADLAPGDFVRWVKQTIDLLDQISIVADPQTASTARQALDVVRRGIVTAGAV